jgi:hypothetical protein
VYVFVKQIYCDYYTKECDNVRHGVHKSVCEHNAFAQPRWGDSAGWVEENQENKYNNEKDTSITIGRVYYL